MFTLLFKFVVLTVCVLFALYMAANAWRNSRRLNSRIRQFKAEQEAQKNQPGAINPYAALAELYEERSKKT